MAGVLDVSNQYISKRGLSFLSYHNVLAKAWKRQLDNPYHEVDNPEGIVNMGTSENQLVFDLVSEKFKHLEWDNFPEELTRYNDFTGMLSFRKSLANFMQKFFNASEPLDEENIIVMNGCGSVIESLAQTLADEGEAFLVPSPFYGGFAADLECRAHTHAYSVVLESKPRPGENQPFQLTVERLEEALEKATNEGVVVKGLILCNPNNPLGDVYSQELLLDCLEFANKHKLHVIVDEIYMFSAFEESCRCPSALSLPFIPDKERLHVVWGFSKDFALSGFRCGVLYTWNRVIKQVLHSIAYFQSVPAPIQHILSQLLADSKWLEEFYFPENRRRIRHAHSTVTKELTEAGVKFLNRDSGLYVWADLRHFLATPTEESELELFNAFIDNGVYITPGCAFRCGEPGWFRIIFTIEEKLIPLAIHRLKDTLVKAMAAKSEN